MRPGAGAGPATRFVSALLLSLAFAATAMAQAQTRPAAAAAPASVAPAPSAQPEAGADAQDAGDDDTKKINLPNVNVQGKRNVFNDNDKKIKDLQESLPCTGCDAKPHTKRKFVRRVLDAVGDRVLPTEAPDHSDRDPSDKAQEFSQRDLCNASNVGGCVPDNAKP